MNKRHFTFHRRQVIHDRQGLIRCGGESCVGFHSSIVSEIVSHLGWEETSQTRSPWTHLLFLLVSALEVTEGKSCTQKTNTQHLMLHKKWFLLRPTSFFVCLFFFFTQGMTQRFRAHYYQYIDDDTKICFTFPLLSDQGWWQRSVSSCTHKSTHKSHWARLTPRPSSTSPP